MIVMTDNRILTRFFLKTSITLLERIKKIETQHNNATTVINTEYSDKKSLYKKYSTLIKLNIEPTN